MTAYTFIRGGNWRHGYDPDAFTVHTSPAAGTEISMTWVSAASPIYNKLRWLIAARLATEYYLTLF